MDYFGVFDNVDAAYRSQRITRSQFLFLISELGAAFCMPKGLLLRYLTGSEEPGDGVDENDNSIGCVHHHRETGGLSAEKSVASSIDCKGQCMRCELNVQQKIHAHCLMCASSASSSHSCCFCVEHAEEHFSDLAAEARKIMARLDGDGDTDDDGGDEMVSASSVAADAEGADDIAQALARHNVSCIACGVSDHPVTIFYCFECQLFAPIYVTPKQSKEANASVSGAVVSVDSVDVIMSRLLLACDVIHTLESANADSRLADWDWVASNVGAALEKPLHLFLHVPELFLESSLNEEFEIGLEETTPMCVLPNAWVVSEEAPSTASAVQGSHVSRLVLKLGLDEPPNAAQQANSSASPAPSGGLRGYVLEFESPHLLQSKLDWLQTRCPPFHPSQRFVYSETQARWILCCVLTDFPVTVLSSPESRSDGQVVSEHALQHATGVEPVPHDTVIDFPPVPRRRLEATARPEAADDCGSDAIVSAEVGCPLSGVSRTASDLLTLLSMAHVMHMVGQNPPSQ